MIRLPSRLKGLLDKDDSLEAAVSGTLATVSPLVAHSHLPFFPEYTDHGIDHLQTVLQTADALIPDSSHSDLTAADAATLVLAILLHDLGMHLTESGFFTLIEPNGQYSARPLTPDLDPVTWPQMWEDFVAEAKRFDGRSLKRLFGDTDPIRRPPSDPEQLTRRDRKLIGEFLRRHHARLAHDIANRGFPTNAKPLRVISPHLPEELTDLAGLVARSHGSPIRSCLPFLEKHFHLWEFQGVHAVYLMVVLRIADYLQVQSDRAPAERLRVVDIKSPASQGEWSAHRAIKNITFEGPDPAALDIKAIPTDVQTFLRLQDLLGCLQKELDLSWAVLGEVYGRHQRLGRLALELRRVRSNLDDLNSFATSVSYIPERARFESVDADLLSLLVEPLYGKNVNIGVRELIQNAVDACRELKDYCEHTKYEMHNAPPGAPDVSVVLTGDDASGYQLTIADRGIGMTADTVRNYFLKAGASYRSSDAWRRAHESEPGKSRVLRSGRFGIGVLAAFLLGDELEVTTRHVASREQDGVRFRAALDSDAIELQRCNAPVGTTVLITLRPDSAKSIKGLGDRAHSWRSDFGELPRGLYVLKWPSVDIRLPEPPRGEPILWPAEGVALPPEWNRITADGYEDVQWSYRDTGSGVKDELACNGIAIGRLNLDSSVWRADAGMDFNLPSISVFDPNGKFPLVLTRTAMATRSLPFQAEVIADICRDLVAFCLTDEAPTIWRAHAMKLSPVTIPKCHYLGLAGRGWERRYTPYVMTRGGFALRNDWILRYLNLSSLVVVSDAAMRCPLPAPNWAVTLGSLHAFGLQLCDYFARSYLSPFGDRRDDFASDLVVGARIHVPVQVTRRWPNSAMGKTILKMVHKETDESGAQVYVTERFRPFGFPFKVPDAGVWAVAECTLKNVPPPDTKTSAIGKAFVDLLGTCLIPYDLSERRARFGKAFNELGDYISRHEELAKKKPPA